MRARPCLVAIALTSFGSLAAAQEAWVGPVVTRTRGLTTLTFAGPAPSGKTTARLRRADSASETIPVDFEVDAPRARATLRTPRLLLSDSYVLELVDTTGKVAVSLPFRLGSAAEVDEARALLRRWYADQCATLRDLCASLELNGSFSLALSRALPGNANAHRRAFEAFVGGSWRATARRRRMDLATYRRRVLLPRDAALGRDLLALPDLLSARAKAWLAAVAAGAAPAPNEEVEAPAARVLATLGIDPARLEDWRASGLAVVPPSAQPGKAFESPLGFRLPLPAEASVRAPRTPTVRLAFRCSGATVMVHARDLPDEKTPDAMRRALEVTAWETWQAYRLVKSERLTGAGGEGLRLEFRTRFFDPDAGWFRAHVVQRSLFLPGQRRAVSLLVVRPSETDLPKLLSDLEGRFEAGP